MRSWRILLLASLATLPTGGCSTFLAIDQWKCDNLGCCMPWVRPSNSCPPPCNTGAMQSTPTYLPYTSPDVANPVFVNER